MEEVLGRSQPSGWRSRKTRDTRTTWARRGRERWGEQARLDCVSARTDISYCTWSGLSRAKRKKRRQLVLAAMETYGCSPH